MKRAMILRGVFVLSLVGVFVSQGLAQTGAAGAATRPTQAKSPQPRIIRMTVSAAAVPSEPLKYGFVYDPIDQTEGNAAPFYMRAMLLRQEVKDAAKDDELFGDYLQGPIGGPKRGDVEEALGKYGPTIAELRAGAVRETCRWEQGVREKGVNVLLPELRHMRSLVRLLAVEARIQISRKQYENAIDTLRAGFTVVGHINDPSVLIQGLVAIACDTQLMNVVRDLAQQSGAPNLYWAIARLPRPIVDGRQAMMWERDIIYFNCPQLRDAAKRPLSTAEWEKLWADLQSLIGANQLSAVQAMFTVSAIRDYPKAKKYLAENGFSAEQVEKMPVAQTVGIYFLHTYEQIAGNMWKWWLLPYPQARAGLERLDKELVRLRAEDPANLVLTLFPSISGMYHRFVLVDHEVAATQIVEAIRAYAADHGGQLPKSLDDLTETPALPDPFTGKPFMYRVDGKTAILESQPDSRGVSDGVRFEITLR